VRPDTPAEPEQEPKGQDESIHGRSGSVLLQGKNAVVYGGGEAIGGAVARGFAREGARVFLAGRTLAELDQVARTISAAGGKVEAAEVDALDEQAVDAHAEAAAPRTPARCSASWLSEPAPPSGACWPNGHDRHVAETPSHPQGVANVAAFVASGSRQRHDRRHPQPHLRLAGRLLMQLPGGATR
jgi:NAD(P)-dependent dehydrogenase (short-subunit alcohol dehydrogenase family)